MQTKILKNITVYAGSADHLAPVYLEAAYNLGRLLAIQERTLIFGGGKTGMMGAVADGALEAGGEVIGVINDGLNLPNLAHAGLTRMEVLAEIQPRKKRMSELADAIIALPGGYGTFDEAFEALTWAQIGLHQKGVGFLNVAGYYDPFVAMIEHAIRENFIYPEHRKLLRVSPDAEELLTLLDDFVPPENMNRWLERP